MEKIIESLQKKREEILNSEYQDKLNNTQIALLNHVVNVTRNLDGVPVNQFVLAKLLCLIPDKNDCNKMYDLLIHSSVFDFSDLEADSFTIVAMFDHLYTLKTNKALNNFKNKILANKYYLKSPLLKLSLNEAEKDWFMDYKDLLNVIFEGDYERLYNLIEALYKIDDIYPRGFSSAITYVSYLEVLDNNLNRAEIIEDAKNNYQDRKIKRVINKDLDKHRKGMNIDTSRVLHDILAYLEQMESEKKKFYKNKNKSLVAIDEILNYLNKIDTNGIIVLDSKVEYLLKEYDPDNEVIKKILEHNDNYLFKLESEVRELESQVDNNVLDLFVSEHIDIHKLGIYHVMLMKGIVTLDFIKEAIKAFKSIFNGFNLESTKFGSILVKSNINAINMIGSYVKRNIVDIEFLEKHYEVFTDEFSFNILHNNIEVLESFNASLDMDKTKEILMINSSDLLRRIKICKFYGIDLLNCDTLSFLKDDTFIRNIDIFIETGNLDLVINYPSNLSLDENSIKRLVIYNTNNIPYRNDSKLFATIKTGKNSLVSVDELDKLLMSESTYIENNELLECPTSTVLDNYYYINEYLYDIDGIMISRKKVLRNLALNDDLLSSVVSGSLLDPASVNIIKTSLESKLNQGRSAD